MDMHVPEPGHQISALTDDDRVVRVGRRAAMRPNGDNSAFRDDVMPFAGLRHSGLGVGGIPYTMEDMQIEKMMVVKSD